MKKPLWKLALGRFAWVVLTEMKGKRVIPAFPISLHRSRRAVKTQTLVQAKSHHIKGAKEKQGIGRQESITCQNIGPKVISKIEGA